MRSSGVSAERCALVDRDLDKALDRIWRRHLAARSPAGYRFELEAPGVAAVVEFSFATTEDSRFPAGRR